MVLGRFETVFSTIVRNTAVDGAGVAMADPSGTASARVHASRVDANVASGNGGGLYAAGGQGVVINSRLGFNRAASGGAVYEGEGGRWHLDRATTDAIAVNSVPECVSLGRVLLGCVPATSLICQGLAVTVDLAAGEVPTDGDDVIAGTDQADVIDAGAGDDVICALGGDDVIDGGLGRDRIQAGQGDDVVRGGPQRDRLSGGEGHDVLSGGSGSDRIDGGFDDDRIVGRTGDDRIVGGFGDDRIIAGDGDDGGSSDRAMIRCGRRRRGPGDRGGQ